MLLETIKNMYTTKPKHSKNGLGKKSRKRREYVGGGVGYGFLNFYNAYNTGTNSDSGGDGGGGE